MDRPCGSRTSGCGSIRPIALFLPTEPVTQPSVKRLVSFLGRSPSTRGLKFWSFGATKLRRPTAQPCSISMNRPSRMVSVCIFLTCAQRSD